MPLLRYMLTPQQRRRMDRQARTDKYGSPTQQLNFPATAATVYVDYAVRTLWPILGKFLPLNWIEVVNNDVVPIQLTLNGPGGDVFYIPAGSVRPVNMNYDLFRITNLDAAVTSTLGSIRITGQRKPVDADEAARLEL